MTGYAPSGPCTPRMLDVARAAAADEPVSLTAARLGISESTVKQLRAELRRRTATRTMAAAVILVYRRGELS